MFAQDIAGIGHSDLALGIPLYSDLSYEHDFVVQAGGAFDETVGGILNAARCGLRVELRIVITKINFEWLPRMSRFISRNFPFGCNVAFMGLEPVGLAKGNLGDVWVDPDDYGLVLAEAVQELKWHRIPVSLYNHQLCTISPALWDDSRQSISDWKNVFLPQCHGCAVRHRCCGFFASGKEIHSRAINPIAPCD
jgi:His-Xaa-Ser system radical SAM maturase HxsC